MADTTAPSADAAGTPPLPITHDAMFRVGIQWPEVLLAILRLALPAEVTRLFAGEPELLDAKFLDARFVSRIVDLLARVPLVTGPEDFAFILLEHKSAAERFAAVQVAGYKAAAWDQRSLRTGRGLPYVIPLLVYCGEGDWHQPLAIADLIEGDNAVADYARRWASGPVCPLVDLAALPPEGLEGRPLAWAFRALMRGAMRHAEQEALLPGIFARLPEGSVYESQALRYVLYRWRLDGDLVQAIINAVNQSRGDRLMQTWGMRFVEKHEAIGEARGEAKGKVLGKAEGEAKGKVLGKAEMLLKAMRYRFSPVPAEAVAKVNGASAAEIEAWSEAVFEAPSLAALLEG